MPQTFSAPTSKCIEPTLLPLDQRLIELHLNDLLEIEQEAHRTFGTRYAEDWWDESHFLFDLPSKWLFSVASTAPENCLVGYIVCSLPSADCAHIHRVAVSQRYRGSGLFERMLIACLARITGACVQQVSVTFHAENQASWRIYQKYGFRQQCGNQLIDFLEKSGRSEQVAAVEGDLVIRPDGTPKVWFLWQIGHFE